MRSRMRLRGVHSEGFTVRRSEGFTLIELMVALALAAMLSMMIMYISSTAQEAYVETVQKVEVYNQFRLVLDRLREDVSNWIPSQELEFYNDGKGSGSRRNFHYDVGEKVADKTDEHGSGVVDGGRYGEYDEYAYIVERHYQSTEKGQIEKGDRSTKLHDSFEMYFRTMTYIDGLVREANVEYKLVDLTRPRKEWRQGVPPSPTAVPTESVPKLALYKIVRYFDIDEKAITNVNQYPVKRRIIEVATNVTDFRLEYISQNPFARGKSKGGPKFVVPSEDFLTSAEPATRPKRLRSSKTPGKTLRKTFGYGTVKLGEKFDLATATPAKRGDQGLKNFGTLSEPVRIGFRGNRNVTFAEIVPGDQVYFFTQADRGVQSGGGGGGVNVAKLAAFPTGSYSVRTNIQGMLELVEDIDSSTWGDKDQTAIYYKAAFLPAAVRITLRMVNSDGLNPKTMQQVVRLQRKSN